MLNTLGFLGPLGWPELVILLGIAGVVLAAIVMLILLLMGVFTNKPS